MGKTGDTKDVEKKEVKKVDNKKVSDKKTTTTKTSTKKTSAKSAEKKPVKKGTTTAKKTEKKPAQKSATSKSKSTNSAKKTTTTKAKETKVEEKKVAETKKEITTKKIEEKAVKNKEENIKKENKKEIKKVDEKAKTSKTNKEEKNNDKKTSICIFIGVILAIVIIFAIGVNLGQIKINFPENKNVEVKVEEKNENKEENQNVDNRKIDYSKDFVYNASYNNGKFEKMFRLDDNRVWRSSESLKYPIINLNSSYAKQVNDELKARFNKYYNAFGGSLAEANIESKFIAEVSYKYAVKNDIVSVIVEEKIGSAGEELKTSYYTYNININTMQKVSFEEVYKACDFKTSDELNNKIKEVISTEITNGNLAEDSKWDGKVFYIGSNGKFSIIVDGKFKIEIK